MENELINNFALVTADSANSVTFTMNGERDDCTGFMNWLSIWKGVLYSYEAMKQDCSVLEQYKAVMFSGHPAYFESLIAIANKLKGKVVTMFLPEGDISQYDMYGINSFSDVPYKAMNSVDVICSMEEDKIPYYSAISNTPAVFVHVPIDDRMASGEFRFPIEKKSKHILVYADNNPNCPVTVFGLARRLKMPLKTVCIPEQKLESVKQTFDLVIDGAYGKLGQYPFLRLLGSCLLNVYPTRWIGSSRQSISCAIAGTPCIGSDRSHTQRRLFPDLAVDIYDVQGMAQLIYNLSVDIHLYQYICNKAWSGVQFYNLENTKKRFLEAYRIGKERSKC